MRLKTAAALAAICLAVAAGGAFGQTQVMNMQNADIRVFIQDIARASGRTIVVDPRVQGTVSVSTNRPMSRDQLFDVLLSTLRANGLVAIPTGPNTYRVTPDEAAASQPSSAGGARTGFTTRLFFLKTIEAADAAQALRPLIGKSGSAQAAPGNVLIVADYADNIARIQGLIDQIDQDHTEMRTIALNNGSAREMIDVVNQLIAQPGGRPANRIALASAAGGTAVVLRGDPVLVGQVADMINELDSRAAPAADVRVIRLENASARELLPVLQQLIGQAATPTAPRTAPAAGQSPAPPASASLAAAAATTTARPGPTIALFEGGNALVISADAQTQRDLADVIRQLDVRREQVQVTAIVVEVSDSMARQLGVQFGLGGASGGVATNFPANSPGLLGVIGAAAAQRNLPAGSTARDALVNSAASAVAGQPGLTAAFGGQAGDVVFGAIINAVKSDSTSNLISTPSIITLDNQEAHLSVGQEVPVTTGEVLSASNTNPFRTVERRDVGVQLQVTPQINAGGGITLTLRQEVSSVAGPATVGSTELAFNKREFDTTLLVDDGDIVVLGGLLDQSDTQGVDKVPGLGDLPGIGGLFRSNNRQRTRRNLMVFIRPTILKSRADAQSLAAKSYDFMRADEQAGADDGKSALEAAVRDYLKANPPAAPAP